MLEVFEDRCSGTKLLERKGLMELLDRVNGSIQCIVATETDRISRDVFQFGWLSTHIQMQGASISFVNESKAESASERAFAKIRSVFSEFETELRQARIKRGREIARQRHVCMHRPPLGYTIRNRRIVIDPSTRPLVEAMFDLAAHGQSINSIAKQLNLPRSSVHYALRNPFYMEKNRNGSHETFISAEVWRKVNRESQSKNRDQFKLGFTNSEKSFH